MKRRLKYSLGKSVSGSAKAGENDEDIKCSHANQVNDRTRWVSNSWQSFPGWIRKAAASSTRQEEIDSRSLEKQRGTIMVGASDEIDSKPQTPNPQHYSIRSKRTSFYAKSSILGASKIKKNSNSRKAEDTEADKKLPSSLPENGPSSELGQEPLPPPGFDAEVTSVASLTDSEEYVSLCSLPDECSSGQGQERPLTPGTGAASSEEDISPATQTSNQEALSLGIGTFVADQVADQDPKKGPKHQSVTELHKLRSVLRKNSLSVSPRSRSRPPSAAVADAEETIAHIARLLTRFRVPSNLTDDEQRYVRQIIAVAGSKEDETNDSHSEFPGTKVMARQCGKNSDVLSSETTWREYDEELAAAEDHGDQSGESRDRDAEFSNDNATSSNTIIGRNRISTLSTLPGLISTSSKKAENDGVSKVKLKVPQAQKKNGELLNSQDFGLSAEQGGNSNVERQQQFNSPLNSSSSGDNHETPRVAISIEDQNTKKYRAMLKAGVPAAAVRHKMVSDGLELDLIEHVLEKPAAIGVAKTAAKTAAAAGVEEKPSVAGKEPKDGTGKYRAMLKAGVPAAAVKHKMVSDELEGHLIMKVLGKEGSLLLPASAGAVQGGRCSTENDTEYVKYREMLKAGVPEGAVRHKMSADGVPQSSIDLVIRGDAVVQQKDTSALNAEDKAQAGKYQSMLKAGVPMMAVRHKMVKDGIGQHVIDVVCKESSGSGPGSGSRSAKKQPSPSKLLTLHWTPLGLSAEEYSQSVWAQRKTSASSSSSSGTIVSQFDRERLEALFSKKASPVKTANQKASKEESKQKRENPLDTARMQNLAIGLRSFKDGVSPADIGPALNSLEGERFSAEQLSRLEEMIPTDAEIKAVKRYSTVQAKIKAINSSIPALEPAENFVLGFDSVFRSRQKLAVLTLMKTLDGSTTELLQSFELLAGACGQVTTSTKLARLLAEVLAVGNVMNEGTSKGDAKGITVDSLLKLTQTKSACKTLNVLDFIVDSMVLSDSSTRDQTLTLPLSFLPEENREDNKTDVPLDAAAPLKFYVDLPDIEAASRLPFGELCTQIQQFRQALGAATRELEKLKEEERTSMEDKKNAVGASETGVAVLLVSDSSPAAQFKERDVDPRANLMVMLQARASIPVQNTTPPAKVELKQSQLKKTERGDPQNELPSQALDSLGIFITHAESRIVEVELKSKQVRQSLEELAAFFGERGQDQAGYIFECLCAFATMTKQATANADKRMHIAAKQQRT